MDMIVSVPEFTSLFDIESKAQSIIYDAWPEPLRIKTLEFLSLYHT